MIPILKKHDHQQVIGLAEATKNGLSVEFKELVSQAFFEEIFGYCGYMIVQAEMRENNLFIKKAEILEWSDPHD